MLAKDDLIAQVSFHHNLPNRSCQLADLVTNNSEYVEMVLTSRVRWLNCIVMHKRSNANLSGRRTISFCQTTSMPRALRSQGIVKRVGW